MSLKPIENSGLDPLLWANRPQSQNAFDAIVEAAKADERFKTILAKHVADGVCTAKYEIEYVWSFAAGQFVRPAWYVRANRERAAA